jgi:branched-chain amino acid transport system permease protein
MPVIIYTVVYGLNYALIALGFTLVFGVSKILNLLYGSLYMTAAYMVYLFNSTLGFNLIFSDVLSVIITILIGVGFFLLYIRIARDQMSFLMSMFLSALLLQYIYSYFFGGQSGLAISGPVTSASISVLGVSVPESFVVSSMVSVALISIFWIWIEKTGYGKEVRATANDPEMAQVFGINPWRITLAVFIISTFLVSITSILIVPSSVVTPTMWLDPFVVAFAVSIIAGLGKFRWIIPSAFILSFSQVLTQLILPYNMFNIVGFLIMIIILLTRPVGLGG